MRFGGIKVGWLTINRILSCHPGGKSVYDPVPENTDCEKEHNH